MADYYSSVSGNHTGSHKLSRMQLEFRGTVLKFAVNPEDYTQSMPYRVTVTQTKGGAWLDAWGGGIVEFTIKGVTGVKGHTNNMDTGYQRWRQMRQLFADVYESVNDGQEVKDLIKFSNYTDNEYWWCYPAQGGIELYRSKSQPNMYQYVIHLLGIRQQGQAPTTTSTVTTDNPAINGAITNTTQGQTQKLTGQGDVRYSVIGSRTSTKPIASIQEDSRILADRIESVVGGVRGLISPATGYGATDKLELQPSGTVSNVVPFACSDLTTDENVLTVGSEFRSRIAIGAYSMAMKIRQFSPEVLSPDFSVVAGRTDRDRVAWAVANSTDYRSELYSLIREYLPLSYINRTEANRLKMVLVDSMHLYHELYRIYSLESIESGSTISTTISTSSVKQLEANLSAMILYLTLVDNTYYKYRMDFIPLLRRLQNVALHTLKDILSYL